MAKIGIWERRKQAQQKIIEALVIEGGDVIKLPSEPVGSNEYHLKLHPDQINAGVSAFILTLLMHAGSTSSNAGEVDLYALLQEYLLLPDFREEVNNLMKQHPLSRKDIKASLE